MTNVLDRTSVGFERGFNDQQTELAIDSLEVKGAIPGWLSGTLVRN
jgi:carotenoid cleavage dioxygenase-like enzyme